MADVVEHLLELDRRRLVLDKGFPSLFAYCLKVLGYSESETFLRIRAARAAAQFPRILDDLREGRLHLDSVARLYPHLTQENSDTLLESASGATKKEVLALLANFESPPAERDVVTPIAAPLAQPVTEPADAAPRPVEVIPSPRQRFHFTADAELLELVDRLRGLLRHKYPSGRFELIFKEAARALLARIDSGHHAKPKRERRSRPGSRSIPAAIKRAVWARDGGQCVFVSADGRRCGSRDALEYDHIIPWSVGGRSDTSENVRLLCRSHNQHLGRRRFGDRRRQSA